MKEKLRVLFVIEIMFVFATLILKAYCLIENIDFLYKSVIYAQIIILTTYLFVIIISYLLIYKK